MLGSGFLAQFGHVFLRFILILVLFSSNFFNFNAISLVTSLFLFSEKISWFAGILLREIGTFCPLAIKLLVPGIIALQIALFFTENAHHSDYCSHLIVFCGFNCNFISPHLIIRGCINDFEQMGLS